MEGCLDKETCRRKHERWCELQKKFVPVGEEELEHFRELLFQENTGTLLFDRAHFSRKRSIERVITEKDVYAILENGWIIERSKMRGVTLLILSYLKSGQHYRPIHVVCDVIQEDRWVVVTAYNPLSKPWKWNESFEERICFCK